MPARSEFKSTELKFTLGLPYLKKTIKEIQRIQRLDSFHAISHGIPIRPVSGSPRRASRSGLGRVHHTCAPPRASASLFSQQLQHAGDVAQATPVAIDAARSCMLAMLHGRWPCMLKCVHVPVWCRLLSIVPYYLGSW